jgi:hypothetical protein
MAIDIRRYNRILENDINDFKIGRIKTDVPLPTENDYKIGYIQRYFIQKRNDEGSYIYEVTKQYFSDILDNPFFKGVVLKWKISGIAEEVRQMNQKSISYSSKDMKKLPLYLPNHLQFHKEIV